MSSYCMDCGSRHIQYRAWVDVNSQEIVGEDDGTWCNDCEQSDVRFTDIRYLAAKARLAYREDGGVRRTHERILWERQRAAEGVAS